MLASLKKAAADLGKTGERLAEEEYKKQGYEIIARNEFNKKGLRLGETDFIAKNKTGIVFVEVKTRTGQQGKFGQAEDSVNVFKQRKMLLSAKVFLASNPKYQNLAPRIDVCIMEKSLLDNSVKCAKIIRNAVEDWN